MNHKIAEWENEIYRITDLFQKEFGSLSIETLNWKPSSEVWSVGQNIDHIITINKSYYPAIEAIRRGEYKRPWTGRFSLLTSFFGNFILKSVSPDRRRKMKTFPVWDPASSNISGDILKQLEQHQQELIEYIRSCKDLLNKKTVIASPASNIIVYTLDKAFDIMLTHELRHFNQAKENLALKNRTI